MNQEFVLLLNVYVDDLTLSGHRSCHSSFWKVLAAGRRLVSEPGFVSFRNLDSSCFGTWIRLVSERG